MQLAFFSTSAQRESAMLLVVLAALAVLCPLGQASQVVYTADSLASGPPLAFGELKVALEEAGRLQLSLSAASYEGPAGFSVLVCVSYGFPASGNVSSWYDLGCRLERNSVFLSASALSLGSALFPRAGALFVSVALLGPPGNLTAGTLRSLRITVDVPTPCPPNSVPVLLDPDAPAGSCVALVAYDLLINQTLTIDSQSLAQPGLHALAFQVDADTDSALALAVAATPPSSGNSTLSPVYLRWNGSPSPDAYDVTCPVQLSSSMSSPQCVLSFPRTGLTVVVWRVQGTAPAQLTARATLSQCGARDRLGRRCDQRLFQLPLGPGVLTINPQPGETTLLLTAELPETPELVFGIAGFSGAGGPFRLYVSRYGFPSPLLGEERVATGSDATGTAVVRLSAASAKQRRWYARADFPANSVAAFVWWAGSACPGNCSGSGACDAVSGVCACVGDATGPLCTAPALGFQWILVIVIVSFIGASVILAWVIRCYRQRTAYRSKYEEI